MPDLPIRLLINAFLAAGAVFAIWKGDRPERTAALIVLANVAVGTAGKFLAPGADGVIRLLNDGGAALALLAVTVRFAAPWMGGVMLFFAAQFGLHSYYLVVDRPHDYLYALVNNLDWLAITWCLIVGAAVAWWRRARLGRLADQPAP